MTAIHHGSWRLLWDWIPGTTMAIQVRLPSTTMWNDLLFTHWVRVACVVLLIALGEKLCVQGVPAVESTTNIVILVIEGKVEVSRAGSQAWDPAYTNQVLQTGDRVRTRERSQVTLRLADESIVRFNEKADFQIQPSAAPSRRRSRFHLLEGMLFFFHRDKPGDIDIDTKTASAAIRGTEFTLEVEPDGRTVLTVFDGAVDLSNDQGKVELKSGDQGIAEAGQPPYRRAAIDTINVIQWALYYPGVLDLDELTLGDREQESLRSSLAAYRTGDLLRALAEYPADRTPESAGEKIYLSALVLAVGQVDDAEALLTTLPQDRTGGSDIERNQALADAIRQLIAAVKLQPWQRRHPPELATEWLAESYYQQSVANLPGALAAARKSASKSPAFGFGWARVAELEFSFGRTEETFRALETALRLAPRNAQALALYGFLLTAKNRIRQAVIYFEEAIAIDGTLANAWLGRGLCRIRRGETAAGREDLLVAAALEPQRALLRSYLGKAYGHAGDRDRASNELELAKKLDDRDPTAWLYSALLEQQHNEINDAVSDLEKSRELNENRRVYRSRLLLDQDRAVRSANLANVYRDAGMDHVSVREAARAVNYDYANYSAHLFLANSYEQLRDPRRIELRYETVANSEYLVASLLAPADAGMLSPAVSQQEYSKLFSSDGLGVVSSTEYLSSGDWVQSGSQFGTIGNFSYAMDALYRRESGQRVNNDLEERVLAPRVKLQLSSQDSVNVEAILYDAKGGDLHQDYDQASANPSVRFHEQQEPVLNFGYHHEWGPGVHTLFLASWLNDTFSFTNALQPTLVLFTPGGILTSVHGITMHADFQGTADILSTELQQIWERPAYATIVGVRIQGGSLDLQNLENLPSALGAVFPDPPAPALVQEITGDFRRFSVYGYQHWQIGSVLRLIGGLTYDRLIFPENFRTLPLSGQEKTVEKLSPKAGLILTPATNTTVRFAYTRSLSGASLDQSYQLEPSQLAGFIQSYRSVIPESVAGANAGAEFETIHASFEQKFASRTYLGVEGEILVSKVERAAGTFVLDGLVDNFARPSTQRELLDYRERSAAVTLNQLIGDEWSIGARYRLSQATYHTDFVDVPDFNTTPGDISFLGFQPRQELESVLHQLNLFTVYNHPSGIFAQVNGVWSMQSNRGYTPDRPGDDFWQSSAFVGYRFPRRKAELAVGVLNITDQDYQLNPLTPYQELPRERTFVARLKLSF